MWKSLFKGQTNMYVVYHRVAIYLVKPISFLGGCEVHEISSISAINTTFFPLGLYLYTSISSVINAFSSLIIV